MSRFDDEIQRGRYEAYVTPSNFLGEAGAYDESIPTLGPVPDAANDDPADVATAFDSVETGSRFGETHTGMTAGEMRAIDDFEHDQDALRARYQQLLADGYDPEAARREIAETFGR